MRALLCQLSPRPRDVAANVRAAETQLAAHPDADLAVFPELFLPGYDLSAVGSLALPLDAPELDRVRVAARRHATAVVIGFAEARPDGRTANAVACVDADGDLRAVYRKANLFGAPERAAFAPGESLVVAELAGRSVGLLVCFDVEFPEPARALARAGAEVLVTASANMEPYAADHALALRARALDNRRPHVYVNRVGREAGLRFAGGSAVAGPGGELLASLDADERVSYVDVDVDGRLAPEVDYLACLRADPPVAVHARPAVVSRS